MSRRIFSSRDVSFNELDFSLNTQLRWDSSCNDSGKVGQFGNRIGVILDPVNGDS